MELLDAILAFALTLAALATIVTIVLETGHRALGMRRRNLARIMKLLYAEITASRTTGPGPAEGTPAGCTLGLAPDAAWEFVRRTLSNPAVSVPSIPTADEIKTCGARPQATITDRIFLIFATIASWFPGQHRAQQMLAARTAAHTAARRMETAQKDGKPPEATDWQARIGELTTVNLKAGVYDKVSVEHVLRRLAETPEVQQALIDARAEVEAEFNRLARKFEEFGSAVSADFKRRSQTYSMLIGIVLALAVNIDGVRIFESLRNNPAIAQAVIAEDLKYREAFENSTAEIETIERLNEEISAARTALAAAQSASPPDAARIDAARTALADAKTALGKASTPVRIRESADSARSLLIDMKKLGLPIGADYFPHCWNACSAGEAKFDFRSLLAWIVSAVLTGALIGLGAPFWFDVAKRLAEVRAMFGGTASSEARLSGKNANADPAVRQAIVKNVLADALPAPPAQSGAVG